MVNSPSCANPVKLENSMALKPASEVSTTAVVAVSAIPLGALAVLMRCFGGDVLDFHGKHYRYSNVPVVMKPLQQPHPPFWYASSNEIGSTWGGEHGLHFVTLGSTRSAKASIEAYREALAKRGAPAQPKPEFPGGAVIGLAAGYLVSGFLVAAVQTLPLPDNFLGYEPRVEEGRRYFPPDRIWLATMHRAGAVPFSRTADTFDADGTFTLRYGRYRRYSEDQGEPLPYRGELDKRPTSSKK